MSEGVTPCHNNNKNNYNNKKRVILLLLLLLIKIKIINIIIIIIYWNYTLLFSWNSTAALRTRLCPYKYCTKQAFVIKRFGSSNKHDRLIFPRTLKLIAPVLPNRHRSQCWSTRRKSIRKQRRIGRGYWHYDEWYDNTFLPTIIEAMWLRPVKVQRGYISLTNLYTASTATRKGIVWTTGS